MIERKTSQFNLIQLFSVYFTKQIGFTILETRRAHRGIHYQQERRPRTLNKGKEEEEHLWREEIYGEEAGEGERAEEGSCEEREEA
jgi:hypothetical protein